MRLQRWKPAQLLWIVGIANLASSSAILVAVALSLHLQADQRLPSRVKIPVFLAIGLSYAASLISESFLQRGIRYQVWPESLLATPRRLLSHPALAVITGLIMVGGLILFIILPLRSMSMGTLFLVIPLSFSRINYSLNRPSADPLSTISLSAYNTTKPLKSSQWGK